MKKLTLLLLTSALSFGAFHFFRTHAADSDSFQGSEIITLRWDGRDNSYVIRSNAKIEKLKQLFDRYPRPEGIDERVYYLTIAMNAMTKEGFDYAGTLNEHVVMKRAVAR